MTVTNKARQLWHCSVDSCNNLQHTLHTVVLSGC